MNAARTFGDEGPQEPAQMRDVAARAYRTWARAWADYQSFLSQLNEYEERSREWVRTGRANGVWWPPSPDARARWR